MNTCSSVLTHSHLIAEPCPRPVIITSTVLCQVKAVQSVDVSLSAAESQSQKSNHCHHVHAHIHQPVSSPLLNDHHTVSQPLYIPQPSQLTSAEPRLRSGKPARQPPRVTGQSHSEDTSKPVCHPTYTVSRRRPYAPGLSETNGTNPGRPLSQLGSIHKCPFDLA